MKKIKILLVPPVLIVVILFYSFLSKTDVHNDYVIQNESEFKGIDLKATILNTWLWDNASKIFSRSSPIIVCDLLNKTSFKCETISQSCVNSIKNNYSLFVREFNLNPNKFQPIIVITPASLAFFAQPYIYIPCNSKYNIHELTHALISFYFENKLYGECENYRSFEEGLASYIQHCLSKWSDTYFCDINSDYNPKDPYSRLYDEYTETGDLFKTGIWQLEPHYRGELFMALLRKNYGCDYEHCIKKWWKYIVDNYEGKKIKMEYLAESLNYATGKDVTPLLDEFKLTGCRGI